MVADYQYGYWYAGDRVYGSYLQYSYFAIRRLAPNGECWVFYDSQEAGWHQTWLGVPVLQNPCDNQEMQEYVLKSSLTIIIEAGTYKGGSALHYATFMDQLKPTCKILTIDTEPILKRHQNMRYGKNM